MFDLFKIKNKLNFHDKKVAKAIGKAMSAVSDLTKVNNSLVTMGADAIAKSAQYTKISENVDEKMETNKNMIDALKQITTK